MSDVPPILWGLLLAFIVAGITAARRSSLPREFLPAFLTVIGVTGLRQKSPVLYWCGIAILGLMVFGPLFFPKG